jgi:Cu(I)/Ag(I) efflux system membrane fusion protein
MTVAAGAMLFRINGLGSVWVYAEIPESRAAMLRVGTAVETRTPALPGKIFKGRVAAILPEVNPATRTLKARIEVANAGGLLTPGMFASVDFSPSTQGKVVVVPSEAVIQTGERRLVIVQLEDGKFEPTDVETGAEVNGQIEIRKGLTAGQKVVISSQFLIDSESSLKSTTARMSGPANAKPAQESKIHRGDAKVEAINKDTITLSHGPIPSLQWGAMTMDFKIPAAGLPKDVRKGDSVSFELKLGADGQPALTAITRVAPAGAGTGK